VRAPGLERRGLRLERLNLFSQRLGQLLAVGGLLRGGSGLLGDYVALLAHAGELEARDAKGLALRLREGGEV